MNRDPSTYIPEAVGAAAEAAERLTVTAHDAKDAAIEAARRTQQEFAKIRAEVARVAERTEQLAKENPWATAGTMLGVGILLGAVGYKLFSPKPTVSRVLGIDHLQDQARGQMRKQLKAFKKLF